MENAIDINDVTACQFLCQVNSLCNYFVYNADDLNCQLLSSPSRTCDLIRGPPTPTLNDCSIDPSNNKTYFEKNNVLVTCFRRFQVITKTYFDKKECHLINYESFLFCSCIKNLHAMRKHPISWSSIHFFNLLHLLELDFSIGH